MLLETIEDRFYTFDYNIRDGKKLKKRIIKIFYNGPGTVDYHYPMKSGQICCADNQKLTVVEIVNAIVDQFLYTHQNEDVDLGRKLQIEFYLDCDGGGGQFYSFADALEYRSILYSSCLDSVLFFAPCAFDEVAFSGK